MDINDEEERRRYEGEQARLRSPSSLSISQKAALAATKPASLYVSNWSDDEKTRRSKDPMRLDNAQLADR